ncbi:SET domain-containing protein [Daldinia vernicosa]|uniref:SET domain-containing protein n=1 Tax=Daldinia vernicosa TaxID=114800 RepID=UPI002007DB3B|nr:SET domain-containing protein [Daldinia vernicosa]KAI0849971.1 SET domain-containing protein [Daldinia vernicosa]
MAAREFQMLHSLDIRPSEGRGFGLFATANIPAKTIICQEAPTFYAPAKILTGTNEEKVNTFCDMYASARVSDRNRLNDHIWIPEHYERNKDLYNWFDRWLKKYMQANGSYQPEEPRTEMVEELIKAYTTFWTNASGTPDRGAAVYSTFARANHSCRPNASWRYTDNAPYYLEMVTECDIPAGDEVTVSYDYFGRQKLKKRRERLASWGFVCKCEKCTEEEFALGRK